ncbi:hypothetical protein B0H21DRAFT_708760 [Amylocystis lapponica]|nr:hypothetical protein B0H21DRAFT_708760 [Amylocystis lapponica]
MANSTHPTRRKSPRVPVDIWEDIIDLLREDLIALRACALTCWQWVPRSRLHLFRVVELWTSQDLALCTQLLIDAPHLGDLIHELHICHNKYFMVPISRQFTFSQLLNAFPAMLLRKLPRLDVLSIGNPSSNPFTPVVTMEDVTLYHTFFPVFSLFRSVTRLELVAVHFSTAMEFAQLIHALSNLSTLHCRQVVWRSAARYDPTRFETLERRPALIHLHIESMPWFWPMAECFLDAVSLSSLVTLVLPNVFAGHLDSVSRVLWAARASLRHLTIGVHGSETIGGITAEEAVAALTAAPDERLHIEFSTCLASLRMILSPMDAPATLWTSESRDHVPSAVWAQRLLAKITSEKLDEIALCVPLAARPTLIEAYEPTVDAILARPAFAGLKRLVFLHPERYGRGLMEELHAVVRGEFPLALARGIVRWTVADELGVVRLRDPLVV